MLARRMHVERGVRMAVMPPVLGRPPQHAALGRGLGQEGEQELSDAAGLVGAMREVAVIPGPDPEHPQHVQRAAEDQRRRRDPGPDRGEAGQMHQEKGTVDG